MRATSAFSRVEGDAGTQPADGLEVVAGEADLGAVEAQRQHEIVRRIHEPEALRQDADDLARRAVDA